MTPAEMLTQGIDELGLDIPGATLRKLLDYLALIGKWNRVHNLTAVRKVSSMVSAHLLDSLAILPHLDARFVLDVGSGAGLPGIPLALAWPGAHVTLLDSNQKKAAFLRQVVIELGIKNAEVVCQRVENWQSPQPLDLVISRAFSELSEFLRLTERLSTAETKTAVMKGVYPGKEICGLPAAFKLSKVVQLKVPGLGAKRHLLLVERKS